jgi:hypothetical protein
MNKELLTELFSTDADLLNVYHILAPNSAEVCAERTMNDLIDANVKVCLIQKNNRVIGYYGIENRENLSFLTGFFLTPENRTKEMIQYFWTKVDSEFDSDYFAGLHSKNTRAIDFLSKKTEQKYNLDNNVVLFQIRR